MPLGVVNDDEFDLEISKCNLIKNESEIIDLPNKGRNGQKEVPDSLRKIIGETSEIEGRPEAVSLARQFNISPSSVSAYSNGATSTKSYNESKSSIRDHINRSKERISKKARSRLISALDQITPEKLAEAKLIDVSSVARQMAAIVKDMEPEIERSSTVNQPQFIFYAPQFKSEQNFEVIHSTE